jgi:hypothetical protein
VNENSRYMDESERSDQGIYPNADKAIAACKAMVDAELNTMRRPGMTVEELYQLYISFGPDPFVVPLNPDDPDIGFQHGRMPGEMRRTWKLIRQEKALAALGIDL